MVNQGYFEQPSNAQPSASEVLAETRRRMRENPDSVPMQNPYTTQSVLDPNLWRSDTSSMSGPSNTTHPSTRPVDSRYDYSGTPSVWSGIGPRSTTPPYPAQGSNFYPEEWSQPNSRLPTPNEGNRFEAMPRPSISPSRSGFPHQHFEYPDSYERRFDREMYEAPKPSSDRELNDELKRLANKLQDHLERPTSPFPKRGHVMNYVDSLASFYIRDKDDVELLRKLVAKEDEFVMSAIDLFASDKDQENLLDTLVRIIKK